PAGNLGNAAALGKALEEARAWGLIDHAPRLAAVQAQGAAPFAQSFREGFAQRRRVEPHTVASAINIGNPVSYERAVRAIRDTNGVVTTVSDDEILEAKAVVDAAGIGREPARTAVHRRALPTAGAHAVLRTPFGRQLAGPGGARHDRPPRGWPRDDLNEVVGDLEGPAVNVEDGFERGKPRYAVPSPAP